ncbi:molecular chaperone DnaJ [Candidatus Woesearchaeota archaeon]|nr:molecular chaperone DnaJ [Candidatus Woesearchaeota archaeon]
MPAKEKDYYKILGIGKSSTKEDVKAAYKRLAKQYHPDLNKSPDAAEKFKEINEAAAVLGDDQKRAQYDQYGTTGEQFQQGGFGGFDFSDFMSDIGGMGFDFDSIFENFFGGGQGQRSRRRQRGSDLRYDLGIEMEDAAFGATRTINIPRLEECGKCNGRGAESASDIVTCHECNGRGVSTKTQRTPFGLFSTTTTCRKCRGEGKYIKNACNECDGRGFARKTRSIEVRVPEGAVDGTNLRMQGEGQAGEKGAPAGDLYVVVHVKPHNVFERHGNDVYVKIPIPFTIAALGGEIEVPTLKGKASLKIPAGTQSSTIFRMKGLGIPDLHSHHKGDQHVEAYITVPDKLNKKQKQLLEEFEKESGKKGLFKGVFG